MNRNEAKRIAAEKGCELFNWRAGSMYGWTLWDDRRVDANAPQVDYSTRQLKELTLEQLLADCDKVSNGYSLA